MSQSLPSALTASRMAVRALIPLNLLFGGCILALLIASLIAKDWYLRALGVDADNATLIHGMRLLAVIGIASIPLAHVVLTRLLAIVETVGLGDPFVAENAARLQTTAWALLGLELLHLAAGALDASAFSKTQVDIDWSFSVAGWLAVLLLFVLARVFDHGARMREDLTGTV